MPTAAAAVRMPLITIRRIVGDSMLPSLKQGQIVIGVRARNIRAGDVVVVRHNGLEKIKRVKERRGDKLFLIGDNTSRSTDSRNFGWLHIGSVTAKIIWPNTARTED